MSEPIRGTCRGCGRILIIDKDKRIVRHEAPTCRLYDEATKNLKRIPDYYERTKKR